MSTLYRVSTFVPVPVMPFQERVLLNCYEEMKNRFTTKTVIMFCAYLLQLVLPLKLSLKCELSVFQITRRIQQIVVASKVHTIVWFVAANESKKQAGIKFILRRIKAFSLFVMFLLLYQIGNRR